MPDPKRIKVGQIVGTFGLKGQFKVQPLTDFVERLDKGHRLFLKGDWIEVEECRWHKNRPLIALAGINHIAKAEPYVGEYLEALADERPHLEEDEFFTSDLIGLQVVTAEGEALGVIDEVLPYPAHDTLRVGVILIPVVKQFVKDVDLIKGIVRVQLIPGMRPGEDDS